MAFLGLDMSRHLSPFTVPVVFVSALLPQIYALSIARGTFDNANPRAFGENVTKSEKLDTQTKNRIIRARGASANGFETLGCFAATVVLGLQAGIPAETLNSLTFFYVASRFAYNVTYVFLQENPAIGNMRSVIWQAGAITILTVWIKAGLAMMDKGFTLRI